MSSLSVADISISGWVDEGLTSGRRRDVYTHRIVTRATDPLAPTDGEDETYFTGSHDTDPMDPFK